MLDDIGVSSSDQVAAALQVSVHQVNAWRDADQAPHLVCLALFWLTRWGMSAVSCEAINAADLQRATVAALRAELAQVNAELARVIKLGDFGCANSPIIGTIRPLQRWA